MHMHGVSRVILLLFAVSMANVAGAQGVGLEGTMGAYLERPGGESIKIADVTFTPGDGGYTFSVAMTEAPFGDEFLSMRPFKCIDGETMYCHLVYPYDKKNTGTSDQHINLEYEFLFIVRSPKDYGINPYNGRYFVLQQEGASLRGKVYAVDLDILAAPPDAGVVHPVTAADLDELEPAPERFPELVIR